MYTVLWWFDSRYRLTVSFPLVIVAGLDRRYGWSSAFSLWLDLLGLILISLGCAMAAWESAASRFFFITVRIGTD